MEPKIATKELVTNESHSGNRMPRDTAVWTALEDVLAANEHGPRHILELWPCYVRRVHMARFLAHYELFKQVIDLPGCVVEMGVYRGPSLLTWAKLMETFCPGDRSRRIFGFDSFKGLQDFNPKDGKPVPDVSKVVGGWSAEKVKQEVEELVRISNLDNFISGHERCKLITGNITLEFLLQWLEENPGLRISLLHLDVDLYEPTLAALKAFYPRVVTGGVVIFDEYGLMPWEGESQAVDEYFASIGERPLIKKFPTFHNPHGYMIKS